MIATVTAIFDRVADQLTHRMDYARDSRTVHSATERQEEAALSGPPQVVPQPARRAHAEKVKKRGIMT